MNKNATLNKNSNPKLIPNMQNAKQNEKLIQIAKLIQLILEYFPRFNINNYLP